MGKVAFTTTGEALAKRDLEKVKHEMQVFDEKEKKMQVKFEAKNTTIVKKQAPGIKVNEN